MTEMWRIRAVTWGFAMIWARAVVAIGILVATGAQATSYGFALENRIWDLRSGEEIDRATLVERLTDHDAVLLGEVHDNAEAHNAQGALVRLLQPKGLAVEMIQTGVEDGLNAYFESGGSPENIGKKVKWDESGWPAWSMYAPVFRYWTPGVLTGAALPRSEVRRSMTDGAASIPLEPSMKDLLEAPLSEAAQASIEAEMVESHCGHLPKEMAPGMVQAQRLRDASQAAAILRAHKASGGMVALIAGNGHTRKDRGAGTYLPDEMSVASVGILEADIDIAPEDITTSELPYDFAWFVAPAEREDPCAALLKHLKKK